MIRMKGWTELFRPNRVYGTVCQSMLFKAAIALGAGLASALLFFIPMKGTTAAMMLAFVGPLPIMIAGLGFGSVTSIAAIASGAAVLAVALTPALALFFVLTLSMPAALLAYLAARRCDVILEGSEETISIPLYSKGQMLGWVAVLSAMIALVPFTVMVMRGMDIDDTASQLAPAIRAFFKGEANIPYSMSAREFARMAVLAFPAMFAASSTLMMAFNLWLAAKIARISGVMAPEESDIPFELRLPRDGLWVLFAAIAACALGEMPRAIASTLAASFFTAYALHGLAVVHGFLRGNPVRAALLFGLYPLIAMTAWPLLIAAAIGMFDSLVPLTRHRASPPATA